MRADQVERLAALSVKLADVVLAEADPDTWPGAGQALADVTKQDRGDRYWCKKNAAATLSLLARVTQLQMDWRLRLTPPGDKDPEDEPDVDDEIRAAEARAADLLEKTLRKHGKKVTHEPATGKR